jgi:uncharacterized protein HemY
MKIVFVEVRPLMLEVSSVIFFILIFIQFIFFGLEFCIFLCVATDREVERWSAEEKREKL